MSKELMKCRCGKPAAYIIRPPYVDEIEPMCHRQFELFLQYGLSRAHRIVKEKYGNQQKRTKAS